MPVEQDLTQDLIQEFAQEAAQEVTRPVQDTNLAGEQVKIIDKLMCNFNGSLSNYANDFKQSLSSGQILVKSIKTGELKILTINQNIDIVVPMSLDAYEVRDNRVVPKQNYSKIDTDMVNIFMHKGKDEPKNNGIGGSAL